MPSLGCTNKEIIAIYNRHVNTVYRICYSYMKNKPETEDMVQETFLKLLEHEKSFANERHEKAWLIVTASNLCKDALRRAWRQDESIEDWEFSLGKTEEIQTNEVLREVLDLSVDQKTVVYMYYYEGYSTREIAKFIRCPGATVRSRLLRARKILKEKLGGDF